MAEIEGLGECLESFALYEEDIENATEAGILAAALHLQRESQKEAPVLTGALVNSAFTRKLQPKQYAVGYQQGYAVYVHENTMSRHENGKAKYLTDPAIREKESMNKIIGDAVSEVKTKR